MMRQAKRTVAAVAVAVAALLALTGCLLDRDGSERDLAAGLVETIDGVEGALVRYGTAGLQYSVTAKLYVPDLESMSMVEIESLLDEAFEFLWLLTPIETGQVGVGLVPTTRPDDAKMGDNDMVTPEGVGRTLGFDVTALMGGFYSAVRSELAEHYGPR